MHDILHVAKQMTTAEVHCISWIYMLLQVSEAAKFEDELIELRGQLQMSELHVQQVCYERA